MQAQLVAHHGGINRVRSMPQQPHVAATWGDTGHVQVWDLKKQIDALPGSPPATTGVPAVQRQAPLFLFRGHKDEGYAIDWSPTQAGQLLTGDCKAEIHLWKPSPGGKWEVDKTPFAGHSASVEDIQWSPTEGDVFASCSVDQRIAIWDARSPAAPALSVHAHDADVNVISWNRLASCMLASGCDDGTFRIWDLRSFKDDSFIAHFKYHKKPITSIEWSFHESSTLATSCADNQTTVWDLSLERDAEEEAEFEASQGREQAEAPEDLPPQLLFVHQGQKDIKEVHWHPQVPGLLVSTAVEGLNVFRPSNL